MRRLLGLLLVMSALAGCHNWGAVLEDPMKRFFFTTETLIVERTDGTEWTSHARGIRPLLDILDHDVAHFAGACCYDRIVGRAAAFLYVKIGVAEVRAPVMSEGAAAILKRHGIRYSATTVVPAIRNRKGDGMCPMDTAVKDLADDRVDEAVAVLRAKVRAILL